MDEGYIKFRAEWKKSPALESENLRDLIYFRQELYQSSLIGAYPDGIGYGNISQRLRDWDDFVISGSTTGNLAQLNENHFARVNGVDIEQNTLFCEGPIIASSESMTHAAVYKSSVAISAVIHVHSMDLWKKHLFKLPTTAEDIPYGTPEMARAVYTLCQSLGDRGVIIMAGHEEGIISFAPNLVEAYELLQTL